MPFKTHINYEFPLENISTLYRLLGEKNYCAFIYNFKTIVYYAMNMLVNQPMFLIDNNTISKAEVYVLLKELITFMRERVLDGCNKKILEFLRGFYHLYERKMIEK